MQPTITRVDGDALGLPTGWYVERHERDGWNAYAERRIEFQVYQEGGATWEGGTPRPEIHVVLYIGGERYGAPRGPEVSWPSTSDNRPELARALAAALVMATNEAEEEA